MPRLILFRHATAENAGPTQADHARALTKSGRREAKAAGAVLAGRGETIDLVLSSDSKRTRETWEAAASELSGATEVRFLRSMFESHDYLPTIKKEGGNADTVVVVGHNPAMHHTAVEVAASLAGRDGGELRRSFRKGALAIFDFSGEWASLRPGQMKLVAYIAPDED